jgi:hypothetical protein
MWAILLEFADYPQHLHALGFLGGTLYALVQDARSRAWNHQRRLGSGDV